jgi:hypothetical protein
MLALENGSETKAGKPAIFIKFPQPPRMALPLMGISY